MWKKTFSNIKLQHLWYVNCIFLFLIVICILAVDMNGRIFGISRNISLVFMRTLALTSIPLGLLLFFDVKGNKKIVAIVIVAIYLFWGITTIW